MRHLLLALREMRPQLTVLLVLSLGMWPARTRAFVGPVMARRGVVHRMSADADDLAKLTVPKLKELLRERSLPVSGKKQELIDRLSGGPVVAAGASPAATTAPPGARSVLISACKS